MPTSLTPTEVQTFTGVTVSQDDIDTADELIRRRTGYDADGHFDDRGVAETIVKQAWSVAAARFRVKMSGTGTPVLDAESQGDYSYNANPISAAVTAAGEPVNTWVVDLLIRIPYDTFTYNSGGALTWS